MKMNKCILAVLLLIQLNAAGQSRREDIYSEFVLYNKRQRLEKDLRENIVGKTFALRLDSTNEHKFESACKAVSQFMIDNEDVKIGFEKLFDGYDIIPYPTRRAFLEAVYGLYPDKYVKEMQAILSKETDPKLFSIAAVYLRRNDPSIASINSIKINMVERFPGYDTINILKALETYLDNPSKQSTPSIPELFIHQKSHGRKVIYSLQRANRDWPGLAIVQNADGRFMRNSAGRLVVFQQLARSASNLPFFITNGSTPQGIYSIQGTAVARNHYIGPTPNIQLVMPHEKDWFKFFHIIPDTALHGLDSLDLYRQLLPGSWKQFPGIMEAWIAGQVGRSEIIAHGTTIDPEYFRDKPYYPLTPTMGCLCAKEIWNNTSGRLLVSEQFNLVSTYTSTPGQKGYLYVINIDNQQKAVSREEVERFVQQYEIRSTTSGN